MSGEESALANKYLELCQVLVQNGQAFSFSLKTNPFSISLDTKEKAPILEPRKVRKKLSPSALRRNQKRKEIFLKNKSNLSDEQQLEESIKVVDTQSKCDQCERTFQSESGLKIHVGKAHKDSNLTRAVTVPGTTRPVPGRTGYQVPAPCSRSPDGREHGLNPGPRSPGDQVGRVYSRAPGDLVNGATVLDTWYRGTKPVSAGVSYLVPWALKHGVRY